MNKLKSLQTTLDNLNLKSEAANISSLRKISRHTDEYLEAKGNYRSLSAQERRKILSNFDIHKTLTEQQRSDIGHNLLDSIGMVPGPGDVADILNVIWYARQKNYGMAAISSVFLVPGLGTPAAALAKTTKVLPAKMIFEFSDEFLQIVSKLEPEIPNGALVKQAVDQIIENARRGYDLNLETGKSIMKQTSQQAGEAASKAIDPANAWYLNPKWQEWFLKIIEPALTRVLNGVTERGFKTRLMKSLLSDKGFMAVRLKFLKDDPRAAALFKEQILNGNTELAKKVSGGITRLIDDVKTNVKIKLVTNKSAIPAGEERTYAIVNLDTSEISVFLPNYTQFLNNPSYIIKSIQDSITHEIWHLIDNKLEKAVFDEQTSKKLMSELYSSGRFIDAIKSNFDLRGLSPNDIKYLSDNSEIYVRIKSIKSVVRSSFASNPNLDFTALNTLVKNMNNPSFADFYKSMPFDAKQLLYLLRNASDEQLQTAVLFMNKVP